MEMGKLTAKLRDAVPVCLLVEGKEIKRYKNIEIPDELKKLEYQDFIFDVPLNGNITFKIIFAPGILPDEWPQARVRRARKPFQLEQSEPVEDMEEVSNPLEQQTMEDLFISAVEADVQVTCEPVANIAESVTETQAIKAEIIEYNSEKRLLMNIKKPENIENTAIPGIDVPTKKSAGKGNGKKGARSTECAGK